MAVDPPTPCRPRSADISPLSTVKSVRSATTKSEPSDWSCQYWLHVFVECKRRRAQVIDDFHVSNLSRSVVRMGTQSYVSWRSYASGEDGAKRFKRFVDDFSTFSINAA